MDMITNLQTEFFLPDYNVLFQNMESTFSTVQKVFGPTRSSLYRMVQNVINLSGKI